LRWNTSAKSEQGISVGQAAMTQCVARVFFDRLLEITNALLQCAVGSLVQEVAALEIVFVSLGIDGGRRRQTRLLLRCQGDLNLTCNRHCQLILQTDDVPG